MMSLATDLQTLSDEMGGLPLTPQDKDEMLKELDSELAKLEKEFRVSNDLGKGNASTALLEILDQQAELLSEKLQVRVKEKMLERVPTLDWTSEVRPGLEDGLLAGDFSVIIDEKANEIFEDVQAFHSAFPSSPEQARIALEDIIETGETDALKGAIRDLKKTFGNTKSLEAQVKALVRVNKAFSKSYKALEKRFVKDDFYCDVPLIAQELYEDFISQHNYVNNEVAVRSFGGQQIGFNFVPDEANEGIGSLISKYRAEFSLTPDFVRTIYLNDETGLTPEAVEKKDWEAISMDILRIVTKGTLNKDFEEMSSEDRLEVSKQAIIRHAKGTYQSYKARGLTRAGKVASDLLENAKLAGEAVVVIGQGLGEMGAEKFAQYRDASVAQRAEDAAEQAYIGGLQEVARASKPGDFGIPADEMRMGLAERQELGIIPKERMSSDVSPSQTGMALRVARLADSQVLQDRLDANKKATAELLDQPEIDAEVERRLKAVGQKASSPSPMSSSYGDWVKKERAIRDEVMSEFDNLRPAFAALQGERAALMKEAEEKGYVLNNPRSNAPYDISKVSATTPEERAALKAEYDAVKAAERAAEAAAAARAEAAAAARVAALRAGHDNLKLRASQWAEKYIDPLMPTLIQEMKEAPYFSGYAPLGRDYFDASYMGGVPRDELKRLKADARDARFDLEKYLSQLYGVKVSFGGIPRADAHSVRFENVNENPRQMLRPKPKIGMRQSSQLKCPRCGVTTLGTEEARRKGCPRCRPLGVGSKGDAKELEAHLKAQRAEPKSKPKTTGNTGHRHFRGV